MKHLAIALLALLGISFAGAPSGKTFGPTPPSAPPPAATPASAAATDSILDFEKDSTGAIRSFDFSIELTGFTNPAQKLAQYKGKNLMLFYFSSTCPHCQQAIPYALAVGKEMKKEGVEMITIATGFNTPDQVGEFVNKYQVNVPMFHDTKQMLRTAYGMGGVPLVMLVDAKGRFVRIPRFEAEKTAAQIKNTLIARFLPKRK